MLTSVFIVGKPMFMPAFCSTIGPAARQEAVGYCVSGPSATCRIVNINNKPAK